MKEYNPNLPDAMTALQIFQARCGAYEEALTRGLDRCELGPKPHTFEAAGPLIAEEIETAFAAVVPGYEGSAEVGASVVDKLLELKAQFPERMKGIGLAVG